MYILIAHRVLDVLWIALQQTRICIHSPKILKVWYDSIFHLHKNENYVYVQYCILHTLFRYENCPRLSLFFYGSCHYLDVFLSAIRIVSTITLWRALKLTFNVFPCFYLCNVAMWIEIRATDWRRTGGFVFVSCEGPRCSGDLARPVRVVQWGCICLMSCSDV